MQEKYIVIKAESLLQCSITSDAGGTFGKILPETSYKQKPYF